MADMAAEKAARMASLDMKALAGMLLSDRSEGLRLDAKKPIYRE